MSLPLKHLITIFFVFYFSVRERAGFCKSCNLICSGRGAEFFDLVHEPATNIGKHLLKTAPAEELSSQVKYGTKITEEGMASSSPRPRLKIKSQYC